MFILNQISGMKKLVIKPIGGFANRLLVVDSAIKLQKILKPEWTIIIWEPNFTLNCALKNLEIIN